MDDLISRQAAIERIVRIRPSTPKQSDYSHGVDVGMAMAIVAIEEQPSAQPDIIRCKDCEFFSEPCSFTGKCTLRGDYIFTNDFCSYAERRTDE